MFKQILFKSAKVKAEIKAELKKRAPDYIRLSQLKKMRLYLKDRLYALFHGRDKANLPALEFMNSKSNKAKRG